MKLAYARGAEGVQFWIDGEAGKVPVTQWLMECAPASALGRAARVLIQLVETEAATEIDDVTVLLSHAQVAKLSSLQADVLGLPPAVPFQLSIRGRGALTDPGFRFQ